jgi:hypothetical protein
MIRLAYPARWQRAEAGGMTETEWLNCTDPTLMLQFLRGKASDRKLRLFACACCRRGWHRITASGMKELVELAERYADQSWTADWFNAWATADRLYFTSNIVWPDAWEAASRVSEGWLLRDVFGNTAHCGLLRDVFGNPFQPWFVLESWLTWNDATIPRLARAVYNERAFDRLPILADALEDADCSDTELLNHLRSPGPHFRGCWAVDLLLGQK